MDPNHKNLSVLAITRKFCRFSKDLANPGASAEFSINSFLVNLPYQKHLALQIEQVLALVFNFLNMYFFYHLPLQLPSYLVSWLSSLILIHQLTNQVTN